MNGARLFLAYLDTIKNQKIQKFEKQLLDFFKTKYFANKFFCSIVD